MIHIAVAEDHEASAKTLQQYLERFSREAGQKLDITYFIDGLDLVSHFTPRFNLLLLDIEMPQLDGITAAQKIRNIDEMIVIIFITNMAQHAIKGYELNALSYLLKPLNYHEFSKVLKRSLKQLERQKSSFLLLPSEQGILRLSTKDIIYLEREDHRVLIHTEDGEYSMVGTLKEMEKQLSQSDFFRCNSGFIVNLAYVRAIRKNDADLGSFFLPISRPRKKAFLNALTNYVERLHP